MHKAIFCLGVLLSLVFSSNLALEYTVTHQVYFDIAIGGEYTGRIEIGLFGGIAPKTVQNFYQLATTGINGLTYKASNFHRVIRRFMIQGGDIISGDGRGSISIYGNNFENENFIINHTAPGILSMANSGPNTNGCQFFITTVATPWLDGHHTAFGKVIKGQAIVHKIALVKTDNEDYPLETVEIVESGSIDVPKQFNVKLEHSYSLWDWMVAGSVPLSFSFAVLSFFQWVIYKLDHIKIKV